MTNSIYRTFIYALIAISLLVFSFLSSRAQTTWDIEREKQHGVLRLKIEGLTLDDFYYFVYRNPDNGGLDTLRNFEMHLDLGNTDSAYGYNMGPIMKAIPPHLYGKGDVFIYRDWYYVSFPILGLDSVEVFAVHPKTKERMRIFFSFDPADTSDYAFQFNFQSGDFFVPAKDLRQYALSQQWREFDYPYNQSNPFVSRYSGLGRIAVQPSQTSNKWLSIIKVENIDPFRFFRFFDHPRFISPYGNVLHYQRHPYFKKYKHAPSSELGLQRLYPEYMNPDTSLLTENPYCVENIFVRPVFLYPKGQDVDRPQVNRRFTKYPWDTTFLALEQLLEGMLFSQSANCNQPLFLTVDVDFPFRSDSIVSVLITKRFGPLPAADFFALKAFNERLVEIAENYQKKNPSTQLSLYTPQSGYGNFPFQNYDVEIPVFCDSMVSDPPENYLHNGYESWHPVTPCFSIEHSKWLHQEFISMVLNPYDLSPYDPESLFGPCFREVVYREMTSLHDSLRASGVHHPFNLHHYDPAEERMLMWGLDGKDVVIFYGNEGEFNALKQHRIPFRRF